jgi:hypothetical protein
MKASKDVDSYIASYPRKTQTARQRSNVHSPRPLGTWRDLAARPRISRPLQRCGYPSALRAIGLQREGRRALGFPYVRSTGLE